MTNINTDRPLGQDNLSVNQLNISKKISRCINIRGLRSLLSMGLSSLTTAQRYIAEAMYTSSSDAGDSYMCVDSLMERTGYCRRSVIKARSELCSMGLLIKTERKIGRRSLIPVFKVNMPESGQSVSQAYINLSAFRSFLESDRSALTSTQRYISEVMAQSSSVSGEFLLTAAEISRRTGLSERSIRRSKADTARVAMKHTMPQKSESDLLDRIKELELEVNSLKISLISICKKGVENV